MSGKLHFMKQYVYIPNARSEEYKQKLEKIAELGIDPFSRENITDPRFDPKTILHETQYWFVFENQYSYPDTKRQFVFVSQQYAESFSELPIGALANLYALAQQVCDEHKIPGGGLIMRFGDPAKSGATVLHLHAQLLVPKDGKKISAWFGSEKEK